MRNGLGKLLLPEAVSFPIPPFPHFPISPQYTTFTSGAPS